MPREDRRVHASDFHLPLCPDIQQSALGWLIDPTAFNSFLELNSSPSSLLETYFLL